MRKDRLLREHTKERFAVTLKSGETFQGLLIDFTPTMYHFAQVTASNGTPAAGTLLVERSNVEYVQHGFAEGA